MRELGFRLAAMPPMQFNFSRSACPPTRGGVCLESPFRDSRWMARCGEQAIEVGAVESIGVHMLVARALALALALSPLSSTLAQSPTGTIAQADARAEVAAALFAASATQAAAERVADAKMRAQRNEIEGCAPRCAGGAAQLRADLTAAEEKYVAGTGGARSGLRPGDRRLPGGGRGHRRDAGGRGSVGTLQRRR